MATQTIFFRNCCKPVTSSRNISVDEVSTVGFGVVSHILGITKPIKRILASHKVKVAQKRFQTLEHIFSKPKDFVPREQRTDSVYSRHCKDCGHVYIRQTSLPNQPYSWNYSEIIATNRRYHQRLRLEAWHINSAHVPLNRDDGGLLPGIYSHLINKNKRS